MGITAAMVTLPLVAVLGSIALWGLLPFVVVAVTCVWWAIERNDKDLAVNERLRVDRSTLSLTRHNPRGPDQFWECQTYWARLQMHPTGGPVPHYLTFRGNGREVELGAFLSEEERRELYGELQDRLLAFR